MLRLRIDTTTTSSSSHQRDHHARKQTQGIINNNMSMEGEEFLVPLKDAADSPGQENRVNGANRKGDSGSVGSLSSSGNLFDVFKPHDLPPVVETKPFDDANSQGMLFSPSFEEHDESMDRSDASAAPLDDRSRFSLPSVQDVIRMFGGSVKMNKSFSTEEESPRHSISSSNGSHVSRHTAGVFRRDDGGSSWGDYSFSSMPAYYEPMHSPEYSKTRSELDMLREQSIVSSRRKLQARSAARKDRLRYKLTDGRKGMTDQDLNRYRTFFPADKIIAIKKEQKTKKQPEIHVWLVSPTHKIFEVVCVPCRPDSTIGEILTLSRGAALDPVLAEQRYVSLCNDQLELVAPMLPVNFLFPRHHPGQCTPSLMAVPEGWTALVVREIQKMLSRHKRVKKWLQQEDIFRPLSPEEKMRRRAQRPKERSPK